MMFTTRSNFASPVLHWIQDRIFTSAFIHISGIVSFSFPLSLLFLFCYSQEFLEYELLYVFETEMGREGTCIFAMLGVILHQFYTWYHILAASICISKSWST
ncbi:hypothetical protein ABZP36_006539 [Zizania latifolia]